ncbi:MAG: 23S rRNA (pseudouridine(1915)-N(3))-methyltransferase RlmH, partial [Oscillospiraceae bacterium]|nr:23S rRNA (pseudouridine(1915)-N(3))-methyltransferase RlmH [Oscillospiraceae bacterium]
LICVGKMKERFYLDAFAEYQKRLQSLCRLEVIEPAEQRLPENPSPAEIAAALEKEGQEILKAIPPDAYVTALCVEGKQMPSEGMAELIRERENSGKPKLCFIIGGSYGLAPAVKARADRRLSMSQMTFPHHLARVMLIEQLYRGFKINEGSRYHK